MSGLIFDHQSLVDGNIFKYEDRMKTPLNTNIQNGALYTTYYAQDESKSTVNRGTLNVDEIFGKKAPTRYNKILDFPIFPMGANNPDNNEEVQGVRDITVEQEAIIVPGTIQPFPGDMLIINHLKQTALFMVTDVTMDSMKKDGFYKIKYRLVTNSIEQIKYIDDNCVKTFHTEYNDIGTNVNPIISEEDHILKNKIMRMLCVGIERYRSMFYNKRHNCFLFFNESDRLNYYDICGNNFIDKHALMNIPNSPTVLILNPKIDDPRINEYYANSIYSWIELDCPIRHMHQFPYKSIDASQYMYSSFEMWGEGNTQIIRPLSIEDTKSAYNSDYREILSDIRFDAWLSNTRNDMTDDVDTLIWKFIHQPDIISMNDISLTLMDTVINGAKYTWEVFFFTPIIVYIVRKVCKFR